MIAVRDLPLVSIHVAVALNGVIGRDGGLPWRLSTDLKRFKALTLGKPIVMGRRTWESFPRRPLPERTNIVVTGASDVGDAGALVAASLDDAMRIAAKTGSHEICVIGGGRIFAEAMAFADVLHVTHVLAEIAGDTYFPAVDPQIWREISRVHVDAGERDSHATDYAVYERKAASQRR